MCFSANASFIAGSLLTVSGVVGIKKNQIKRFLPFAAIPLIFGLQQFSEGLLWLNLQKFHLTELETFSTYSFLILAQVIWPTLIPLSMLLLDEPSKRTSIQYILLWFGILLSVFLLYFMINYTVDASIENNHIKYLNNYPTGIKIFGLPAYAITTILPLFTTHVPKMWLFGIAICFSLLLAIFLYTHYLTSIWCYFAAILSLFIYVILNRLNRKIRDEKII